MLNQTNSEALTIAFCKVLKAVNRVSFHSKVADFEHMSNNGAVRDEKCGINR